ncbi:MAG: nitrogen regulation protein NR(II) [Thiohalophilus sp.]|uniref:nitrogen regulation protein NR(II) n=1 Tax=Thiohalophilus sp. TaxID=3028392 RepID=UPI00287025CF|nr:nitrogen regulation protein NR(II) [Thiohalophilus sp.]MDR9437766.1 nitrogen regulation protein NR(II) [Thiohalophilus sp.]
MSPSPDLQQRVLEAMTSGLMLFDQDLCLRYVNAATEMLFGSSGPHLIGHRFEDLFETPDNVADELREALASGHPFTRHEVSLKLIHGREVVVDLTALPLVEREQAPELLVEVSQMDRLLRIARDESRAAQQQTTQQMLRGLAHEIKNPLGGLRGAAQLLARELPTDELKEYTGVIISEADRLQKLVNRILGPNKMPRLEPVNVHEVLEHVRSLLLAEAPEGIRLRRDYDPSIPDITADRDQIVQALLNIIRNAIEALEGEGDVTLRTRVIRKFTIGQKQHDLVAQIQIIDNGPGIPAEILERIFFPMVSSRAEGTGLGLAIAQSLIQQHNGIIECDSEPGRTVFSIYIPIELEA